MNYDKIVKDVIGEYKASPIDMLGIGDASGEYTYLNNLKDSYARTIRDVDNMFKGDKSCRNILEIGSFLGAVSISLKKIGFNVCALDIPEFYQSSKLKSLYERNGIHFTGLNLRNSKLPQESNSLDAVIICEVMEHLNFNPLPVLQEINRVLKNDGYIYIGMPNQANLGNRIKLLRGRSIHNPIGDFFKQLDRNDNMVVGLHWREYTLDETMALIQKMGFDTVARYYFQPASRHKSNFLKEVLRKMAFFYPPFRSYQVVIGKKVSTPIYDFWLTNANS
jgi:SAM-dependent methyltransferase